MNELPDVKTLLGWARSVKCPKFWGLSLYCRIFNLCCSLGSRFRSSVIHPWLQSYYQEYSGAIFPDGEPFHCSVSFPSALENKNAQINLRIDSWKILMTINYSCWFQSGLKEMQWESHEGLVLAVDWSPVSNFIVSAGEDCRYKVGSYWSVHAWTQAHLEIWFLKLLPFIWIEES